MEILFNIIFYAILLAIGYAVSSYIEKRHYNSIIEREKELEDIIVIASKNIPENAEPVDLVLGSVVVGSDYFKRFVAWVVGIFGGRISVYESLLDRARREALLRLKDDASLNNADAIINVKFTTATLNNIHIKSATMVEVMAYGTAVKLPKN